MPAQPSQRPARAASANAGRPRRQPLRFTEVAAGLALAFASGAALAQASGSVALLSDYRFRGVSLSYGKPAAQLTGAYDDPRGWYVGGAVSGVLARCFQDCGGLQTIVYGGYAARQTSGLSWDVGADYLFSVATRDYRFGEVYAGLAYRDFSARVTYAPDYFGQSVSATYAELNQAIPIGNNFRLLAHVGLLHTSSGSYGVQPTSRADVLLGGALDVQSFEIQLTWQHAAARDTPYATYLNERRSAWVVAVSRAF